MGVLLYPAAHWDREKRAKEKKATEKRAREKKQFTLSVPMITIELSSTLVQIVYWFSCKL